MAGVKYMLYELLTNFCSIILSTLKQEPPTSAKEILNGKRPGRNTIG